MQKYKLFMGKNIFADELACWYVFTHEPEDYSAIYSIQDSTVPMLKRPEHVTLCVANKHNLHVQTHFKSIKTQITRKHIFLHTVPLQYMKADSFSLICPGFVISAFTPAHGRWINLCLNISKRTTTRSVDDPEYLEPLGGYVHVMGSRQNSQWQISR